MQEVIKASLGSLLTNASRLAEKAENGAMQSLLKGNTDKVTHLATIRQLAGIIKQLKDRTYGKSREESREADHFSYPDW